jgi:hypothetical protein
VARARRGKNTETSWFHAPPAAYWKSGLSNSASANAAASARRTIAPVVRKAPYAAANTSAMQPTANADDNARAEASR